MAKPPKVYPPEFRQKILELIRSGESANAVARRFNVSRQTIANWLKQDERDAGRRTDGLTTDERSELTRLRREVKRLTIEQEILSKAAAWFARETDAIPKKPLDS
ncbi:MAG: transposase [Candidatus Eremiobacteraeota bacterium]|jgi:transposase|nr:transposase [Candidatus Eremiobacteraeota bacterium]MEA2720194.1 transposase [Candidatus Eremiobacteraeota bacterium]